MNITQRAAKRRRRFRMAEQVPVNVGEDITAPAAIASGGRIPIRTPNAATVARWFGLRRADDDDDDDEQARENDPRDGEIALPDPGTILLITGPSGAGKSTLLRELRDRAGATRTWIDLAEAEPISASACSLPWQPPTQVRAEPRCEANVPLVDCFGADVPLREVLLLLSRVGLGEVWSYLRPPAELSEGQRWRFRLALALHRAASVASLRGSPRTCVRGCEADDASSSSRSLSSASSSAAASSSSSLPLIACDEFAAVLDRVTAMVVARCLRRAVDADRSRLCAVVATSHDDLQPALKPDVIAWCDFGKVEWRQMP